MARLTAWRILRSGSATPLREVNAYCARAGLDERDRGLVRQLVGTEVRRRGTLRALVKLEARGKPSADVAAHLRLGLAQLFFLDRIPVHAAVSETVRAATDSLGLGRGRYVNAVLRSVLRIRRSGPCGDPQRDLVGAPWHLDKPLFRDPREHPTLWAEDALSLPSALFRRWSQRHGRDGATALALQALSEPPLSLVCTGGNREAMGRALDEAGVPSRPGRHERVLLVEPGATGAVLASQPFASGAITIQGETALRAAELLGAKPGERLLDLAAAPGGKSAVLALAGAEVLAVDKNTRRLAVMPAALERMGIASRVQPIVSDGLTALDPGAAMFDGALVDAPCSNTGVLAARPGARWRFGPESLGQLAILQGTLLDQAARHVAPNGRLVFSTCSLEPEEGQQGTQALLERHPHWTLAEEHLDMPTADEQGPLDGGYRALLRRDP